MNCPFCIQDESPFYFYKNDLFKAIYNKSPILPGHSLIIPSRHVERFSDLTESELSGLLLFTKEVNLILDLHFPNTGFNWTIQDGVAAGQTVSHLHVHVIPRFDKDLADPGDWYPLLEKTESEHIDSQSRPRLSDEELIRINQKLKS
jgi:bis(5'-adenosyl)-triphosphatase